MFVSPLSREATNITQTCALRCIKCPFKIDNYLWHGFICCWPLEGRGACISNTVTNLSTMFPYYKCSKCPVRHLGRPPTSPRNLFKFPFEMDIFWDWFSCCWPLEGRRPCVSNTVPNLSIAFVLFCECFKCLFRHLVGRPPTSPRNVFNCPFENIINQLLVTCFFWLLATRRTESMCVWVCVKH